jgi:hypothetical protein
LEIEKRNNITPGEGGGGGSGGNGGSKGNGGSGGGPSAPTPDIISLGKWECTTC